MLNHILNALGAVGNVLDVPGSMVRDSLAGQNPFDQLLSPHTAANRFSGRDLLRHHGIIGNTDNWGNFAGGLAAETLLDPTNLIGGGLLKRALMRHSAISAENAVTRSANALSHSQRAMGYFPEELLAHQDPGNLMPSGLPVKSYHGTPRAFDQFSPAHDSGENLYGRGFYHTDNPEIASTYATNGARHELEPNAVDALRKALQTLPYSQADAREGVKRAYIALQNGSNPDPLLIHKHLTDAGVPRELREAVVNPSPRNVRMAHLDIRKPFDVDEFHSPSSFTNPDDAENVAKALAWHRDAIRANIADARKAKAAVPSPDDIMSPARWLELSRDAIRDEFPTRNLIPVHQLENAVGGGSKLNEFVRRNGFDSIVHEGGHNMGDVAHNVQIPFEPSQVYKPYIAKAIKAERSLPKPGRYAKGLAAHNALARSRGQ